MDVNSNTENRTTAKLESYANYLQRRIDSVSWRCKICGLYIEANSKEIYEKGVREHRKLHT